MAVGAALLALTMPIGLVGFGLAAVPWDDGRSTLGAVMRAVFLVLQAPAIWLLFSYEGRHPERLQTTRVAARVLAVAGVVVGLGMLGLAFGYDAQFENDGGRSSTPIKDDGPPNDAHTLFWTGRMIVAFVAKLVLIASAVVTGTWLNALARRGNVRGLATASRWISLAPLFGLLVALPLMFLWFASLMWSVLGVVLLVYLVIAPLPLNWIAVVLKRNAAEAETTWAAETKPA